MGRRNHIDLGDEVTSSLKFAPDDVKSLIRTGAGYVKYVPCPGGLRFITWYWCEVRQGFMRIHLEAEGSFTVFSN